MIHPASQRQKKRLRFFRIPFGPDTGCGAAGCPGAVSLGAGGSVLLQDPVWTKHIELAALPGGSDCCDQLSIIRCA